MAVASLLLGGCAAHTQDVGPRALRGVITAQAGRPGLVIAASGGTSDVRTDAIASELARRTGFGVVIATERAVEPVRDGAREVDGAYEQGVRTVAQGPLRFLAEIHGNDHRDAAGRIEIATVGVDRELAFRLRTLLELIRDAHLRGAGGAPRLDVLIEPVDALRYAAPGAARGGILRLPERGLLIELPKAARAQWRETYIAILADFLVQAAAYSPGR